MKKYISLFLVVFGLFFVGSFLLSNSNVSAATSTIKISSTGTIPVKLAIGSSYTIKGTVTSTSNISSMTVGVSGADGKWINGSYKTVSPKAKTYDLKNMDPYIIFGKLPIGNYSYRIVATNAAVKDEEILKQNFEVYLPSKILISGAGSIPSKLGIKKTYSIKGKITSNYNLAMVEVGIKNAKGQWMPSAYKKVEPLAKTYDLTKADPYILFDKIPIGKYSLVIIAKDSKGYAKTLSNQSYSVYIPDCVAKISIPGLRKVKISWSSYYGANEYSISKSTSLKGKYSVLKTQASSATASYVDTNVEIGKTYYYKVTPIKNKVPQRESKVASTKVVTPKVSVTVFPGKKKARIEWAKVGGISGYEMFRATSSKGTYSKVATLSSGQIMWENINLAEATSYYYKARTYVSLNGKTYYSSYSTVKFVKTFPKGYNFSPESAVAYAKKYALTDKPPGFTNYNSIGGDCANFVSQCLYAGGLPMENGWYWKNYGNRSSSWAMVIYLSDYLESQGFKKIMNPKYSDFAPGDVIINNNEAHVTLCTGIDKSGAPLFSGHNYNTLNGSVAEYIKYASPVYIMKMSY
ncbi:MAG: amidase domain-containing protein [Anaerovoracaceae bacterium]